MIALDQVTKLWIVHHFALYERFYVLPVLDITLAYNKGAAFSFLEDASGWQRWLFTGLAFAVGIGILGWMRRLNGRIAVAAVLRTVADPGRSAGKCDRPLADRSRSRFHSGALG